GCGWLLVALCVCGIRTYPCGWRRWNRPAKCDLFFLFRCFRIDCLYSVDRFHYKRIFSGRAAVFCGGGREGSGNAIFIQPQFRSDLSGFQTDALTMKKLGWVQFFSWFALFMMWVYMTPAIAEHVFYKMDGEHNRLYAEAGNWVGVLFGVYNGISAIYAVFLPRLANRFGRTKVHAFGLVI